MKKKILWISKDDPYRLIRPNESGITKLDTVSVFAFNSEVSIATNFREVKDALSINKDSWFDEICFSKNNIDEIHDIYDCVREIYYFEVDNNLKQALYTIIDSNEDDRENISNFIQGLINITQTEEYL